MGLLSQLLGGGLYASTPDPTSDFWYQPAGASAPTTSGQRVDSDTAQKLSAWYRGRDILATVLAMLPLNVMERLPDDGGSEVASGHPLQNVLHDQPDEYHDGNEWRRQKMYDLIDTGWTFDWIIAGRRGFVHELKPIVRSLVTPKRVISGPTAGSYIFDVRDEHTGQTKPYTQDDIFYLRGAEGKGVLQRARESLGTALAAEQYASGVFGKGTLNGGVITTPGVLDEEASKRMARSFVTSQGEQHLPKILEQGTTWVQNTMSPEDAQMLLSRKFGVDDVARWLGLSPMMLGNSDPSFGNAEQFWEMFLAIGIGPWLSMWEFGINRQLILAPKYFAQFKRDAIVRGNLAARWAAHVAAVNAGIKSVDEVRGVEDLNKRGGKADELREPQNITGKPAAASDPTPEPTPPAKAPDGSKAQAIAVASASRLLRKEVTAVQKMAVRHAGDGGFNAAVAVFYDGHAELVTQTLQMTEGAARSYCESQADQILTGDWTAALSLWQTEAYAAGLAAIALETEQAA